MQPHADDVDPRRYTFVGPALALRAHQEQWPVMDRPVLLVSLGSAYLAPPTFYRACLDAFADLDRGADGLARASLTTPDGVTRELWVGGSYHYLQAFSGDTLAPHRQRRALAMEPMTCPPDAFRSGTDVQRLEPGESTTAEWGVRLLG